MFLLGFGVFLSVFVVLVGDLVFVVWLFGFGLFLVVCWLWRVWFWL